MAVDAAGPLLKLPPPVLGHIVGCLSSISRRTLRLTCKDLRVAVNRKVRRLVIQGCSPQENPAVFPELAEVIVMCWKPSVDELDLQLFLAHLPHMDRLVTVHIKASEKMSSASGGGRLLEASRRAATAPWQTVRRWMRQGAARFQAAAPQQQQQQQQQSDDVWLHADTDASGDTPSLSMTTLRTLLSLLACARARSVASHCMSDNPASYLHAAQLLRQARADWSKVVLWDGMLPGPQPPSLTGLQAGGVEVVVHTQLVPACQLGCLIDHTLLPPPPPPPLVGHANHTRRTPGTSTATHALERLDPRASSDKAAPAGPDGVSAFQPNTSSNSLPCPTDLHTRRQRLTAFRHHLTQLQLDIMSGIMHPCSTQQPLVSPAAYPAAVQGQNSTNQLEVSLSDRRGRPCAHHCQGDVWQRQQPQPSSTNPDPRCLMPPSSGLTPDSEQLASSWMDVCKAVQPQLLLMQPIKLQHASDLRHIGQMDACLTEIRLDIPCALAEQLMSAQPVLPGAPQSRTETTTSGLEPRLAVLGQCKGLQRLTLNFTGGAEDTNSSTVHLGSSVSSSCHWDALLQGLSKQLTSLIIRGDVMVARAGYDSLRHLTHLNSLTLWLKGYVTDGGLHPLTSCTHLTNLQVARLHLQERYFHPVLPQVLALSVYLTKGCDHMCDVFPCLRSAVLRDWPAVSDPTILQPLANHSPSTHTRAVGRCVEGLAVVPGGPLTHLLLLQHTQARWQLPWGDLTERIAAHVGAVSMMRNLKVLVFKGFTFIDPVWSLCAVAGQLPCLTHLGLGVAPGVKMRTAPPVHNTFQGLSQITSLHVDCQGCSWDVLADLLLLPCHHCRQLAPALQSLALSGLSVPVSCEVCMRILVRLPALKHLELAGCQMAPGSSLHLLPLLAGRPDLDVVQRTACGTDVETGVVLGKAGEARAAGRRAWWAACSLAAQLGCGLGGTTVGRD